MAALTTAAKAQTSVLEQGATLGNISALNGKKLQVDSTLFDALIEQTSLATSKTSVVAQQSSFSSTGSSFRYPYAGNDASSSALSNDRTTSAPAAEKTDAQKTASATADTEESTVKDSTDQSTGQKTAEASDEETAEAAQETGTSEKETSAKETKIIKKAKKTEEIGYEVQPKEEAKTDEVTVQTVEESVSVAATEETTETKEAVATDETQEASSDDEDTEDTSDVVAAVLVPVYEERTARAGKKEGAAEKDMKDAALALSNLPTADTSEKKSAQDTEESSAFDDLFAQATDADAELSLQKLVSSKETQKDVMAKDGLNDLALKTASAKDMLQTQTNLQANAAQAQQVSAAVQEAASSSSLQTTTPSVQATEAVNASTAVTGAGASQGSLQLSPQANASQNTAHTTGTQQAQVTQQVTVQFSKMVKAGQDEMTIQLRPEALGKIEIKLEFGHDKTVHGTIIAEKASTLETLQKDQASLQKILQEAGLRADSGSLEFSLQNNNQNAFAQNNSGYKAANNNSMTAGYGERESLESTGSSSETYYVTSSGVNLRV